MNPYSVSGPWRRQLEVSWTPNLTSPRLWSCLIVIETSQSHHDHDGSIMKSVGFENLNSGPERPCHVSMLFLSSIRNTSLRRQHHPSSESQSDHPTAHDRQALHPMPGTLGPQSRSLCPHLQANPVKTKGNIKRAKYRQHRAESGVSIEVLKIRNVTLANSLCVCLQRMMTPNQSQRTPEKVQVWMRYGRSETQTKSS